MRHGSAIRGKRLPGAARAVKCGLRDFAEGGSVSSSSVLKSSFAMCVATSLTSILPVLFLTLL